MTGAVVGARLKVGCSCAQHQLDFMMTMHVRSRVFPLLSDAAQFIKAVSGLYDVYIDTKRTHALQVQLIHVGSLLKPHSK